MNTFPLVSPHVGIVDCVIQKNGVTPDDDDGDEDDDRNRNSNVAVLAMREA